MSSPLKGKRRGLSPARKVICEIMHLGMRVPSLPQAKVINVMALAEARDRQAARTSWLSIFMRAYGLVGQDHAQLRQAYIPWPYEHLYEHPQTACGVLVERTWMGEKVILLETILGPEAKSLVEIDGWLRHYKSAPPERVGHLRQHLRIGRLPAIMRRFAIWHSFQISGRLRAKRFGTCLVSSLGNLGCEQVDVISPLTTYLSFGPVSSNGTVNATIVYDHRVMDGRCVARCLNDLERVLNDKILNELRSLAQGQTSDGLRVDAGSHAA